MKNIVFVFKDGDIIELSLEDHVADMWLNEKETIKAIQKIGKVSLKLNEKEWLELLNLEKIEIGDQEWSF